MKTPLVPTRRRLSGPERTDLFVFDGGTHALNFVNTEKNRYEAVIDDQLTDYETFLNWCHATKVIDYDYYNQLQLEGYCYAHEAETVLTEVKRARLVLYKLFKAAADNLPPHEINMREFNIIMQSASKKLHYEWHEDGLGRAFFDIEEELMAPLWMLIQSGAMLLLSAEAKRIKHCVTCGTLFLDRTKNGTRRWCNPIACKSRVNNYRYHRNKAAIKQETRLCI